MNAWSAALLARRRVGGEILDLTEANATLVGLSGVGPAELAALADPAGARYEPHPLGAERARVAVAAYYAARGNEVAPEDVVLTTGTSEAYAHLFRMLCDPGDHVLVPSPSYPLFEPIATLEGVAVGHYRLAYDGRWHLELDSLRRATTERTRLVVLVQPNHPTGTCLSPDELASVEAWCESNRLAIVSDEVFGDYPWSAGPTSLPSALGERRVPTFVTSGLSKVCGMPQLKLGWLILAGPHRDESRRALEWISDLFLSVATPVQRALPRLLESRHRFQSEVQDRITTNRAALAAAIARHPELGVLAAEGGWVSILSLPRRRTGEQWALDLLDHGVAVHPGHFYDIEGESHIVASLIVDPDDFHQALTRLEELTANK